jgi:hypothetical protein
LESFLFVKFRKEKNVMEFWILQILEKEKQCQARKKEER